MNPFLTFLTSDLFTPVMSVSVILVAMYFNQKTHARTLHELSTQLKECRVEASKHEVKVTALQQKVAVHEEKLSGIRDMISTRFDQMTSMIKHIEKELERK